METFIGGEIMSNNNIGCNVTECKHHSKTDNQCTLDHIKIVKQKEPAKFIQCTDCSNFVLQ